MGIFTEEKITKSIKEVHNSCFDQFGQALVTLKLYKTYPKYIKLVVGGYEDKALSSWFSKRTLGNLIESLKEVHEIMEDE